MKYVTPELSVEVQMADSPVCTTSDFDFQSGFETVKEDDVFND